MWFTNGRAELFFLASNSLSNNIRLGIGNVNVSNFGVRPAISLNKDVAILEGNGDFENPYIVG